jgi:hypothetical protein
MGGEWGSEQVLSHATRFLLYRSALRRRRRRSPRPRPSCLAQPRPVSGSHGHWSIPICTVRCATTDAHGLDPTSAVLEPRPLRPPPRADKTPHAYSSGTTLPLTKPSTVFPDGDRWVDIYASPSAVPSSVLLPLGIFTSQHPPFSLLTSLFRPSLQRS